MSGQGSGPRIGAHSGVDFRGCWGDGLTTPLGNAREQVQLASGFPLLINFVLGVHSICGGGGVVVV